MMDPHLYEVHGINVSDSLTASDDGVVRRAVGGNQDTGEEKSGHGAAVVRKI